MSGTGDLWRSEYSRPDWMMASQRPNIRSCGRIWRTQTAVTGGIDTPTSHPGIQLLYSRLVMTPHGEAMSWGRIWPWWSWGLNLAMRIGHRSPEAVPCQPWLCVWIANMEFMMRPTPTVHQHRGDDFHRFIILWMLVRLKCHLFFFHQAWNKLALSPIIWNLTTVPPNPWPIQMHHIKWNRFPKEKHEIYSAWNLGTDAFFEFLVAWQHSIFQQILL